MKNLVVGITGRAGSGKSIFCSFLREDGWRVVEADKIGWEILRMKNIKEELRKSFGDYIFSGNEIDRNILRNIAFGSPEKLKLLNSIVHPVLLKELKTIIDSNEGRLCVDAALIPQWGIGDWFFRVVLLKSRKWKENLRKRGYDEKTIGYLEKIQKDIDNYTGKNVVVIENNGTLEELREKAIKFMEEMDEIWFSHLH